MFPYHARLDDEQLRNLAHEYLGVLGLMELADDKIQELTDKIAEENAALQALSAVHHMLAPKCKEEVDVLALDHRAKLQRLRANRDKQRAVFTMHAERFAALTYHYSASFEVREKVKELRS